MSTKEIRQIKLRIDDLIARIKELDGSFDIEAKADLAKYLCVLISGYFEKCICDSICTYGEKCSSQIARCIQIEFKWTTNIKMNKLLEVIEEFSVDWKNKFTTNPNYDDYKDSLDFIVNNRNNISHGLGSTITLAELEYHYSILENIIVEIKKLFLVYVA